MKLSSVIPISPALAPIINIQKSGAHPVIPNMVVLRYEGHNLMVSSQISIEISPLYFG